MFCEVNAAVTFDLKPPIVPPGDFFLANAEKKE